MNALAVFFGQFINVIIGALAVVTLAGFAYVVSKVKKMKEEIDKKQKESGGRAVYTKGGYQKTPETYTWSNIMDFLPDFRDLQLLYSVFEQFIPIFPLLGILGTVSGLIQQLDHVDQMREALGTSMSTTFWGLIAAIALRVIDAIWVSRTVERMEQYFDTFDQNYQMAKDIAQQEENA